MESFRSSSISPKVFMQDIGCVAIPDVHPQTIAANLEVRSVPEGVTQAVVVILVPLPGRFVRI